MPPKVGEIPQCSGCIVREKFPDTVFIRPLLVPGNRLAIAEAGGQNEALEGTPLVGSSGSWLRGKEIEPGSGKRSGGLYRAAGVDPSTISLCNVLNCSIAADHKNLFPLDNDARSYISKEDAEGAVAHCLNNHVKPLLTSRNWNRVDLLGNQALRALTGLEGGILRWRGSPTAIPSCRPEPLAVPTLHPAFIARNQELLPAVIADLKKTLDVPPQYYNTAPTLEEVKAFKYKVVSVDIEVNRRTNKITMVGLCGEPYKAMCVPFQGVYLPEITRILTEAEELIGHNFLQFDLPRLCEALGLTWNPSL